MVRQMNIFGKRRRKAWFHLRIGRMLFAVRHKAKKRWTTLHRPLFVGSYLQVTWGSRPMKRKKNFQRVII